MLRQKSGGALSRQPATQLVNRVIVGLAASMRLSQLTPGISQRHGQGVQLGQFREPVLPGQRGAHRILLVGLVRMAEDLVDLRPQLALALAERGNLGDGPPDVNAAPPRMARLARC
jgi:hypothetical protein